MAFDISWVSQAGRKTETCRDFGAVGLRNGEALCIVLDGSTTGEGSGELASQIAHELIDWFVDSAETATADAINNRLKRLHETVSSKLPFASVSYMILHIDSATDAIVLHAGDCLLGRCEVNDGITWLNQPHTLANATDTMSIASIAKIPARHRLTRTFRSKEFLPPDVLTLKIDSEHVMATDGFWAELSSGEQTRFIQREQVAMSADGDDRSVLRVRVLDGAVPKIPEPSDNFYVKANS